MQCNEENVGAKFSAQSKLNICFEFKLQGLTFWSLSCIKSNLWVYETKQSQDPIFFENMKSMLFSFRLSFKSNVTGHRVQSRSIVGTEKGWTQENIERGKNWKISGWFVYYNFSLNNLDEVLKKMFFPRHDSIQKMMVINPDYKAPPDYKYWPIFLFMFIYKYQLLLTFQDL